MKLTFTKLPNSCIHVTLYDPALETKALFEIKPILNGDLDTVCEARNAAEIKYLVLLSNGTPAIVSDITLCGRAKLGLGLFLTHYNQHPLVTKRTYPSIAKYVAVTQHVVEGIVLCGGIVQYFTSK